MEANTNEVRVTQAVAAPAPVIQTGVPATDSEVLVPVTRNTHRVRRTFKRVDLGSLLRFSVAFFVCLASAWVFLALLLFALANGAGIVANLQSLMRDIGWPEFRVTFWTVFEGSLVAGVAVAAVMVGITMLTAVLYNLVSGLTGGIEVTVSEDEVS